MEDREHARASHGEQRHGFGKAVNRISPRLAQQHQNRRDEGAGVADTNPPYKIDNGESPAHRDVYSPNAYAFVEQPANREQEPLQDYEADQHAESPPASDRAAQHDRADFLVDGGKGMSRLDDRGFLFADFDFGWFRHLRSAKSFLSTPDSDS